jgi:hypothetical protein
VILAGVLGGDDDDPPADPTGTATESESEEPSVPPNDDTPTPTPTQPAGTLFLNETFDSALSSRLPEFNTTAGRAIIADGQLQIIDNAEDGRLVWQRLDTGSQDVSVEVRAFSDIGQIVMACRDGGNYQVRVVVESREGRFRTTIFNIPAEEFSTYTDWTTTDLISKTEKSRIELVCRGDQMYLLINGEIVTSHTIAGATGTFVWIAADGDVVGANSYFDDLTIRTLP